MGKMLTFIANIASTCQEPALPPGYNLRPCRPSDVRDLGRLYFESYPRGVAGTNVSEAVADIEATFSGAYGELWRDASLVAFGGDEQLVASIQIVRRAPWEDTPDCPFVIELFTAPGHRRLGLARALLKQALKTVTEEKHEHLALRVDEENVPALKLYRSLGFHEWVA